MTNEQIQVLLNQIQGSAPLKDALQKAGSRDQAVEILVQAAREAKLVIDNSDIASWMEEASRVSEALDDDQLEKIAAGFSWSNLVYLVKELFSALPNDHN